MRDKIGEFNYHLGFLMGLLIPGVSPEIWQYLTDRKVPAHKIDEFRTLGLRLGAAAYETEPAREE